MGASMVAAALLLLLLVSVSAVTDMSIISYGERSEEETQRMYAEWIATHGKRSYNAIGEEERQYQVFKDTIRYINEHDTATAADAGVHSFRLGFKPPTAVTNIADDTCFRLCCCDVDASEEMRQMYAEWKATNAQKSYNAIGEEERRYQAFKDTLRYIDEHNAADAGVHSFRLGLIPPIADDWCYDWCCC